AGIATVEAYRATRSHRATADGLLRDYGAFAAWSYRQDAETRLFSSLGKPFERAYRPLGGDTGPASAADLLAYEPDEGECACGRYYGAPYFMRFALDADSAPDIAGAPPTAAVQAWIVEAVRDHAVSFRREWGLAVVHGHVQGRPVRAVYTVLERPGRSPLVYAYGFEPERFEPLFRDVLEQGSLLPASLARGQENAALLRVEVLGPDGDVLFAAAPPRPGELPATDTLNALFGGMVVRAAVLPEVAGQLIIGGLPRSRMPQLAALLVLAAILAGVALGQLRKEEELARLRSDFVASVSHELRTPLTQIRLFLETLRLGRFKTEEQRAWSLDTIDRETTRLVHLVENVLQFSRAERGTAALEASVLDLGEEAAQVVTAFVPLARVRDVRIECAVPRGLHARAHRDALRQVLLNLLDNAVKYGPAGQTVRVTGALHGDHARIAVEDQGPGVPPAERGRIWEPCRRGRSAVGSVAVGSGIGLSVVRDIVERGGGRVGIEDAPGGGARFVVELPAEQDSRT